MAEMDSHPEAQEDARIVMLIDDEPAQSRLISAIAAREGWRTIVAPDAETAIAVLGTREGMQLSAILLDQWVPGDDACALIAELKSRRPALPILMLTTSASPLLAVEAMRAGASDYLVKPVSPDRLMEALRSVTTRETPRDELAPLTEKMSASLDFDAMIGTAPQFRAALAQAAKAARGQGHVLIEGESGTGKEMLMRAMHGASPRAKDPLRTINLASIPTGSIESVLFGHEPGSFPGAFDRQIGAFQHCDGGTLILDEIDRLTPVLQQRLCEALTSGIIRPVGASYGFRVDVRLLVTSNAGLDRLVEAGQFDAALAEKLAATRIRLPALRERTGDIPALTRHFLARIGEQPGLNHLSISESALALLAAYDWPGNVRQLRNVVERTIIMTPREKLTTVEPDMLPPEIAGGQIGMAGENLSAIMGVPLREARESFEREYLAIQIRRFSGNISKTASFIGMERSALHRKLKLLGMADRRDEGEGE